MNELRPGMVVAINEPKGQRSPWGRLVEVGKTHSRVEFVPGLGAHWIVRNDRLRVFPEDPEPPSDRPPSG